MQETLISTLLTVHNPKKYCIWNRTTESALRQLDRWPAETEVLTAGKQYELVLERVRQIMDLRKDLDFTLIDWVLYRVTQPDMSEKVKYALTYEQTDVSSLQEVDTTPPPRTESVVSRIVRDTVESHNLKIRYAFRCQVCGITIKIPGSREYCEVHHLKPLGGQHDGRDKPWNMICVCPNHHVEFDRGCVYIDPDTKKLVHYDPQNEVHGRLLHRELHVLDRDVLEYHRDVICQQFSGNRVRAARKP